MEVYKNIVCATDFSRHSEPAAARAADLAERFTAKLTLLHVVEYFPEDRSNETIAPEDTDPATYRERQARHLLADFAARAGLGEVRQEIRFSTHSAGYEITRYARENHTDLIVFASHGHHGITALLGSTANVLTQRAPCDVLAVRLTPHPDDS